MSFKDKLQKDFDIIKQKAPHIHPKFAVILGSGMGPLADGIKDKVVIPYQELPHFPISKVKGHEWSLILGKLEGIDVVFLKGRVDLYEGMSADR